MKNHNIAYVFCCEHGILEKLTVLLVRSLFHFGKVNGNSSFYCFCPRKNFKPSKSTLKILEEQNIHINDENLNREFEFYPLYNKVVATSYVENKYKQDFIVFLDSDLLVLENLFADDRILNTEVSLQKEFMKYVAAEKSSDQFFRYWERIFNFLEVDNYKFSNLFTNDVRTIAYYNSGLIFSKTSTGLMSQWNENLTHLLRKYHWRNLEYFFLEQATLSATIQQMGLEVYELPKGYNYPISMHNNVFERNKVGKVDELIVCHYLKEYGSTIKNLKEISKKDNEKVNWVIDQFKELKIFPGTTSSRISDYIQVKRNINFQKILYFSKKFRLHR